MIRHCRDCKDELPARLYFKCDKCKSKAFSMDDDSIYVPADLDLDPLTESIVELFDNKDPINLDHDDDNDDSEF